MRSAIVLICADAGTAAPVAAVSLVVDLDNALTCCRDDASRVEHHAGDGVVVGICVVDGTSPKIPDLSFVSMRGSIVE
jgi:hypothetical protein